MVSMLDFGMSVPSSAQARVKFLGEALYTHSASLYLGVEIDTGEFNF